MDAVPATAVDALVCKVSAIAQGYYADPVAVALLGPQARRRPPLVNKAYYARVAVMDALVAAFLHSLGEGGGGGGAQIVSVGAGVDSLLLRTMQERPETALAGFELDLPEIVTHKAAALRRAELLELDDDLAAGVGGTASSTLRLLPVDLRDAEAVVAALLSAGLVPARPTLVVAECVLAYLPPAASHALLQALSELLPRRSLAVFEPTGSVDSYGRRLFSRFERKGCPLLGLLAAPTLEDNVARTREAGWGDVVGIDMQSAFLSVVPADKQERTRALEPFDEAGDLILVNTHYAVLAAGACASVVRAVLEGAIRVREAGSQEERDAVQGLFEDTFESLAATYGSVARFVKHNSVNSSSADDELRLFLAYGPYGGVQGSAGLALRKWQPGVGELKRMCVAPMARRRGVASALLRRILREAREAGLHTIELDTLSVLGEAQHFYEHAGFEVVKETGMGQGASLLTYRLSLVAGDK